MGKHDISELRQLQKLPLDEKVKRTQVRIKQWVEHYGIDHVYVSFSGGKDSSVLMDIARKMYPDIKAVFLDTSLEFPELRDFVKRFDNVEYIKPKMNFRQVIEKYGYPVISKEVSECVYGARKYLTSLLQEMNLDRTEQNRTEHPYSQFYRKICGSGEYARTTNQGGYDNKFRRVSGLGCYSKDFGRERAGERWLGFETVENDGNHRLEQSDKGDYP